MECGTASRTGLAKNYRLLATNYDILDESTQERMVICDGLGGTEAALLRRCGGELHIALFRK
jgi:hypothetical protein